MVMASLGSRYRESINSYRFAYLTGRSMSGILIESEQRDAALRS
jgi:hypothetical protein